MRNPAVRSITPAVLARHLRTARPRQTIPRKQKRLGKQQTARSGKRYARGASFRQVSISPNLRLNRIVLGESGCSGAFLALLMAIDPGQRSGGDAPGTRPGWGPVAGSAGSGAVSGMMGGNHSRQASGGTAVAVRFSVTIRQVREDGSEAPLDGELAAALAAPAEQFAGLAAWAADEAGYLDHGEREKVIGDEGRELQRRLLQATFDIDSAREQRAEGVTSAAGIRHGTVEEGHGRGLASVFGPVRVTRKAYRNRR